MKTIVHSSSARQAFRVPPLGGSGGFSRPARWVLAGIVFIFSVWCLTVAAFAQSPSLSLLDLDGRSINPFDHRSAKAIVFLFIRTDCPISNRYAPELQRLRAQFAKAGVRFWLIYPNDEAAAIKRHIKEYGYAKAAALRDPQQTLVKMTGAQVTPEAAVFTPDHATPRLIYRGRIDDRVIAFGKQRPQPKQRDLEATLKAVLRGQPLSFKEQPAVGCYIAKTDEK